MEYDNSGLDVPLTKLLLSQLRREVDKHNISTLRAALNQLYNTVDTREPDEATDFTLSRIDGHE